ncbi:cytochrome P450 [Nocardia xishanensis]
MSWSPCCWAGHETTATALPWALCELAADPALQQATYEAARRQCSGGRAEGGHSPAFPTSRRSALSVSWTATSR